jgi:hypothetical protein
MTKTTEDQKQQFMTEQKLMLSVEQDFLLDLCQAYLVQEQQFNTKDPSTFTQAWKRIENLQFSTIEKACLVDRCELADEELEYWMNDD